MSQSIYRAAFEDICAFFIEKRNLVIFLKFQNVPHLLPVCSDSCFTADVKKLGLAWSTDKCLGEAGKLELNAINILHSGCLNRCWGIEYPGKELLILSLRFIPWPSSLLFINEIKRKCIFEPAFESPSKKVFQTLVVKYISELERRMPPFEILKFNYENKVKRNIKRINMNARTEKRWGNTPSPKRVQKPKQNKNQTQSQTI